MNKSFQWLALENKELLDSIFNEPEPVPKPRKRKNNRRKHYDTAYSYLNVTPLVEIYSVSIHNKELLKVDEKCEIYGHVSIVDSWGDDFDLFRRGKNEPECIDLDGTLLLSPPSLDSNRENNVIIPSEYVSVDVLLFDKAHNNAIIARGEFGLDKNTLDCRGERMCKRVEGDGGFEARVHYAIFPYAVVANVDVLFFSKEDNFDTLSGVIKVPDLIGYISDDNGADAAGGGGDRDGDGDGLDNDDDDIDDCGVYRDEWYDEADYIDYDNRQFESSVADVYGTVTACNDMLFHDNSEQNAYFDASVLFRKTSEQTVQVGSGSFIELSRTIVAVPAYSSLKIEVDLWNRNTQLPIGRKTVEFKPQDSLTYKKDIVGSNGRIRVRVKWNDAYLQLYRARKLKRSNELAITPEIGNVVEEKRAKVQQSPATFSSNSMSPALLKEYHEPFPLAEVFSIAVCGKNFEPFSFYGKITVKGNEYCIYDRDAKGPQHCPAFGTQVEIAGPGTIDVMGDFSLWVKLRDANNRSVVSKGYIVWRDYVVRDKNWIDKRVCSIIRGDRGFAVVHYSMFYDAMSAFVDVKLYGITFPSRVSGKMVARYGTHDYSSSYDKEYYQSILFNKDAKEGPTLESCGSSIPLLKYVVAMPRKSSLIINADLCVSPVNVVDTKLLQETLSLKGSIEFKLGLDGESSREIAGQNVHIVVSVKCGYGFY